MRAKGLNTEPEERASTDIVQVCGRADRSRKPCVLLTPGGHGFPNDPFDSASLGKFTGMELGADSNVKLSMAKKNRECTQQQEIQ